MTKRTPKPAPNAKDSAHVSLAQRAWSHRLRRQDILLTIEQMEAVENAFIAGYRAARRDMEANPAAPKGVRR